MALPKTSPAPAPDTEQPPGNGQVDVEHGHETAVALPPLNVDGLTIHKEALLAALRIYLPQLADISQLDGERFLLHLSPDQEHPRS